MNCWGVMDGLGGMRHRGFAYCTAEAEQCKERYPHRSGGPFTVSTLLDMRRPGEEGVCEGWRNELPQGDCRSALTNKKFVSAPHTLAETNGPSGETIAERPDLPQCRVDDPLRLAHDGVEVRLTLEALGVNLVDVLRP